MRPTVSQYAEALESLSRDGMGVENIIENFLGFLKRRGESAKGVVIMKQLEKRAAEQSQGISVTVVSAHDPEEETKALLMKKAEVLFPGKSIEARYEVDSSLLGGVRFQTEEMLYDATVSAELRALKTALHKS